MDVYNLRDGLQIDLQTDDVELENLSADYDEVDHELLLENSIGNKIYWDARLRAVYRGTCLDRRSESQERKPALLVGLGFAFHPGNKRRFKYAEVEIEFSDYADVSESGPRIISFAPRYVTGVSNPSTTSRSTGLTLKLPEPVGIVDGNHSISKENTSTNCMRIQGTCRSQGTRLVWSLAENPYAGLGLRGLPSGLEVAFLIMCERPTVMSVHVREVKVGWGMFDRERYMSSKSWPVTSFAREFLLDPNDRRHEPPPGGDRHLKAEDVVPVFQKYGKGLIPG